MRPASVWRWPPRHRTESDLDCRSAVTLDGSVRPGLQVCSIPGARFTARIRTRIAIRAARGNLPPPIKRRLAPFRSCGHGSSLPVRQRELHDRGERCLRQSDTRGRSRDLRQAVSHSLKFVVMAINLKPVDVVVIGLGAAGGVAVLPLARAGLNVAGIEAGTWMTKEPGKFFHADEIYNNVRCLVTTGHKVHGEIPTVRSGLAAPAVQGNAHPMMNAI